LIWVYFYLKFNDMRNTLTAHTSFDIVVAEDIPAGVRVVILNKSITSITSCSDDAGGNTWIVDYSITTDASRVVTFVSCVLSTPLLAGTVITCTYGYNATTGDTGIILKTNAVTGFGENKASTGYGTSISCVNSITNAPAVSVGFVTARGTSTIYSAGAWTTLGVEAEENLYKLYYVYNIDFEAGAINIGGTLSASVNWGAGWQSYY